MTLTLHKDAHLGKLPARPRPKDILFDEVLTSITEPLPLAPIGFGHAGAVSKLGEHWGMLGNDSYGDCVWAGADHETEMILAMNGKKVTFTDKNALADYGAVTGFDPVSGANDNGTDMHDAMNYRRRTGVVDANAHRHKIGAFVLLESGNWTQLLQALEAFDFVAIGFEFPSSAMDQFNAGKPWSYVAGSPIEGGHYVPVVGRPGLSMLDIVTWGKVQKMTRGFYRHYNDESYGVVTVETLNGQGKTPEGLDLTALRAALAAL